MRALVVVLLVLVAFAGAIGALTGVAANSVQHLTYGHEFCWSEWCATPTSYTAGPTADSVVMRVRSAARAASQRPDHPQAWLVAGSAERTGGPQPALAGLIGPGESHDVTLTFGGRAPEACPKLLMSEGGWPPVLGLGSAPSPFAELVDWPLCA